MTPFNPLEEISDHLVLIVPGGRQASRKLLTIQIPLMICFVNSIKSTHENVVKIEN